MSTAVVCVLIGLCPFLVECTIRPREVTHHISTALHKRQGLACSDERVNEIVDNFPDECTSVLADVSDCGRQCLSMVCSDSCFQPFYSFFDECFNDPTLTAVWELVCSRNEDGTLCFDTVSDLLEDAEAALINACEDSTTTSCSDSCMEELEKSNSETGCCLYTLVTLAASQKEADEIWAACDVDTPDLCTGRFTGEPIKVPGSGANTVTSYIFVLFVTFLMALISLQ